MFRIFDALMPMDLKGRIRGNVEILFRIKNAQHWKSFTLGTFTRFQVQYRLCERSGACDFSWISLTKDEYSGVRLGLEKLKPWVPYTIQYRVEQT